MFLGFYEGRNCMYYEKVFEIDTVSASVQRCIDVYIFNSVHIKITALSSPTKTK